MKTKNYGLLVMLTSLTVWMILGGCGPTRSNLVETGTINIEHRPSKGHLFSRTSVYEERHTLIISGEIHRRNASNTGSGHIDIAIVSPENEILEEISINYTPRIIPRERRRGGSFFKVRLGKIPPPASRVRIAHHRSLVSDHQAIHCSNNAATPNG